MHSVANVFACVCMRACKCVSAFASEPTLKRPYVIKKNQIEKRKFGSQPDEIPFFKEAQWHKSFSLLPVQHTVTQLRH